MCSQVVLSQWLRTHPLSSCQKSKLVTMQKGYKEGYDLHNSRFVAWLKINHPDAASKFPDSKSSLFSTKCQSMNTTSSGYIVTNVPKSTTSNPTTTSPHSLETCSMCSSKFFKIPVWGTCSARTLAKPSKRKRKPTLNNKARVITGTEILEKGECWERNIEECTKTGKRTE